MQKCVYNTYEVALDLLNALWGGIITSIAQHKSQVTDRCGTY